MAGYPSRAQLWGCWGSRCPQGESSAEGAIFQGDLCQLCIDTATARWLPIMLEAKAGFRTSVSAAGCTAGGWPENTVPCAMIKRSNYPHRPATLSGGGRLTRAKIKRNKANQNRTESNRTGYQKHEGSKGVSTTTLAHPQTPL